MFEVLPETDPHLLAIRVGGKLTRQDYARLNPWLDEQLARHPAAGHAGRHAPLRGVRGTWRIAG